MSTLLFVYGTLKRGCSNHRQMMGQQYLGEGRTAPGYRLYHLGGYPGLVAEASDREGVTGEVWSVEAPALRRLDDFEGVTEGLYRREPVPLLEPFAHQRVMAYLYARPIAGFAAVGPTWRE